MRSFALLPFALVALIGASSQIRAEQPLGQGRFLDSDQACGDVLFGALKMGRRDCATKKLSLTPDTLQVQEEGSTGPIGGMTTRVIGGTARVLAARAADTVNPRDYGAYGDGVSRTAGSVLGISTLAGLTKLTIDGVKPYAFAGQYPFGLLFNLPVSTDAAAGATTLTFARNQATAAAAASGACTLVLSDVAGLYQGMSVSGAGAIPSAAQVDLVNPSTKTVMLSHCLTGAVASGTRLAFAQPWLSRVTVGMRVSGGKVPARAAVQAVNAGAGTVTLNTGLTAAVRAATSNDAGASAAYRGEPITFYRPYTDAEATGLSMDSLGINAAVQAAAAAGGGRVQVPDGTYLLDMPVVLPVRSLYLGGAGSVALVGGNRSATTLSVVRDLGPSQYAVSCGDPAAAALNGRGLWAENGVTGCYGELRDIKLTLAGADFAFGRRPQVAGVPVAMGGVKQGPRLNMMQINITGFNVGIQWQGDWTTWRYVTSVGNFIGFRVDDPNPSLYGDWNFDQVFFGGNGLAGISVAPEAYINGAFNKSWIADQTYNIWLEPGLPARADAIQQTTFRDINMEGPGCGTIVDGNVQPGGTGKFRGLSAVEFSSTAFQQPNPTHRLRDGCPWVAYLDIERAWGVAIRNITGLNLPAQAGGISLMRVESATAPDGTGGVLLSGSGMQVVTDGYAALGQEIVSSRSGSGTVNTPFAKANQYLGVTVEVPGVWRAKPVPLTDSVASNVAKGTILEANPYSAQSTAKYAGRATSGTAPVLGVTLNEYGANSMSSKLILVGSGSRVPVQVSAAQTAGTLLKVDSGNPGKATAASSLTDGVGVGAVTDPNGGSNSLVGARLSAQAQ